MEAWKGLNNFDDEEMGSKAKEHGQSWKLEKAKKMGSSLKLQEGNGEQPTSWFYPQGDLCWMSNPRNRKMINLWR